jgi:hypothetical protein
MHSLCMPQDCPEKRSGRAWTDHRRRRYEPPARLGFRILERFVEVAQIAGGTLVFPSHVTRRAARIATS